MSVSVARYLQEGTVLILIILEVLYEKNYFLSLVAVLQVLILIILEVLYETTVTSISRTNLVCLNPYYTGSTL